MALDIEKDIIGKKPHFTKDSDKDGIINPIDCKPYDKSKQGIMHTIGAKTAELFGNKEKAEELMERGEIIDTAKREARMEAARERAKKIKEAAIYREQVRGERRIKYIKEGGAFGVVSRSIGSFGKTISNLNKPQKKTITHVKRTTRKKGKGNKRKVKKVSYKPESSYNPYDFRNVRRIYR